jgi:hypothetical protein
VIFTRSMPPARRRSSPICWARPLCPPNSRCDRNAAWSRAVTASRCAGCGPLAEQFAQPDHDPHVAEAARRHPHR